MPIRKQKQEDTISVAEAVRTIVSNNASLLECLSDGLVNYTWVAESIMEEVKKLTGRKRVNIDAIKAALIRFEEELKHEKKQLIRDIGKILAKSTVELQNDISVVTVKKYTVEQRINEIITLASDSRFFNFTQGKKSYTIVLSTEDVPRLLNELEEKDVLDRVDEQSAIILISPYEIMTTPGVVNYLTRLFYRAGINITQIISCYTDTILIINRKDSVKAIQILQDSIEKNRQLNINN